MGLYKQCLNESELIMDLYKQCLNESELIMGLITFTVLN